MFFYMGEYIMKKIIFTLIFTALSYLFIFLFSGQTGQDIDEFILDLFGSNTLLTPIITMFGPPFIYVYIAFKYSRDKKLNEYYRLFFQMYSPWAILGYTIMILSSMTQIGDEFSEVFTAYSLALYISIMIVFIVNIVSFRALLEPDSVFSRINMKLIFISNILLLMIFFFTSFIFLFNGTL